MAETGNVAQATVGFQSQLMHRPRIGTGHGEDRKRRCRKKIHLLVVFTGGSLLFALVDLLVAAQIGHNGEVSTATFHITCESWKKKCQYITRHKPQVKIPKLTLFASVAVHMGLERRRTSESLVAHLALVLLLGVGRHLGAKLAHHRLRARRRASREQAGRTGQRPRQVSIVIRLRGGRAIIGHRRVDGADGRAIVGVIRAGRDRRSRRMGRGEAIRVT